jgi:hypothetical protein
MDAAAPLSGAQAPLVSGRPVRFDLAGEDKKLADRNRSFGRMALVFFAFFFGLGTLFVFVVPGRLGLWNYAIWLPLGSILLWMWLGFALTRPLTDLTVSPEGLVAHNTKGKEFRYTWRDPSLRIVLSHSLTDETSPFRTPTTDWRIAARPPSSGGQVPENCYEYLVESAKSAGLSAVDRKYFVSTKGGGYWMVETAIRPAMAG